MIRSQLIRDLLRMSMTFFEGYEPNYCFITHPLFLTPMSTKEDWRRQYFQYYMSHSWSTC